jgi:hypothetical protein
LVWFWQVGGTMNTSQHIGGRGRDDGKGLEDGVWHFFSIKIRDFAQRSTSNQNNINVAKILLKLSIFQNIFNKKWWKQGKDWDSNSKIHEENKLANNHELQTFFTRQLIPMLKSERIDGMGRRNHDRKHVKVHVIHSLEGPNEVLLQVVVHLLLLPRMVIKQ